MKTVTLWTVIASAMSVLVLMATGVTMATDTSVVAPSPSAKAAQWPVGAPWLTELSADGTGWTACATYKQVAADGDGCFIQFVNRSIAGQYLAGVTLNGGLVNAHPGQETGDLDIALYIDGKPGGLVAITGRYGNTPAGIIPAPTGYFQLGGPENLWKEYWAVEKKCPAGVPGSPKSCVTVNGKSMPLY